MTQITQLINFSALQNQQTAKNSLQIILDAIGRKNQFVKNKAHQFLTALLHHLQSKQASPKSKFYSLWLLRDITQNGEKNILSVLSSHNILKYLALMAKQTDPNKNINQKGKSLFNDKQIGNDYIRLILQTLKVWGQKFPKNKENQPTKFRKVYDELQQFKIIMPTQFKFYTILNSRDTDRKVSSNSVTPSQSGNVKTSLPNVKQQTPNGPSNSAYKKDIEYSLQKINAFIEMFSIQPNFHQYCLNYHKQFTKDLQKIKKIINDLCNNPSQQNQIQVAIAINQFYQAQAKSFQQFVTNKNDYYSYAQQMQIKYDEMNQMLGDMAPSLKRQNNPTVRQEKNPDRKNNLMNVGDENKDLVNKLLRNLEDKSKSPTLGFKSIKQNLSKDKNLGKSKRSTSNLKKSSVSKFGKSMSKSRIAEIFSNPPNLYPPSKRYQGQAIQGNAQLQKIMKNISKHQGIRRFITCNFKSKNPLFENTHLQIGVKTEPIYEQINQFKIMISVELYFGNKTQDSMNNVSIEYKGNSDVLLYGTPRNIEPTLRGGYQTKHQLMIVPLNYQFPFINMRLKYTLNGQTFFQNIVLPNSILKLAHYRKLQPRQFIQHFNNSSLFKTAQFKLTRYIPPDSLNKYISSLSEMSSYQQFILKGSETDYELGCLIVMKQQYEGVLRIYVRPNLNAIIQVGILENSEDAHESFIFYAQTLKMILSHIDHQQL